MEARVSRTGLVISALGAMAMLVSVFLPWYGVSFTQAGVDFAEGTVLPMVSRVLGPAYDGRLHAAANGLVGHRFVSLSAHQALSNISTALIVAGAAAAVLSVVWLAGAESLPPLGGVLAAIGLVAASLVVYRLIDRPDPAPQLIAMSLRGGAYLALLGAGAIVAGAMWPRARRRPSESSVAGSEAWADLSGWTPSA